MVGDGKCGDGGTDSERRFSPYCWRIRMALAHKGLEAETVPWRFTEKEAIDFSGQKLVPVLVHGDHVVSDSWQIACYLEDTFPERPSLFGGASGRALSLFVNSWSDTTLVPTLKTVDTVMQCQAQRGILEFSFVDFEPGMYMFHAHQTEFVELGWMSFFEVLE